LNDEFMMHIVVYVVSFYSLQHIVYNFSGVRSGYWLGLSGPDATGNWSWVDGTQVTLRYKRDILSNTLNHLTCIQSSDPPTHLLIHPHRYWTGTNVTSSSPHCAITWKNDQPFGWSDVDCTAKNGWICEKPALSVELAGDGSGDSSDEEGSGIKST